MEDPPRKFFRLGPGREVRLRFAYFVTCTDVVKDDAGNVVELRCTYDPATRGGDSPDGRKVKGTIHWVSAEHAIPAEVRVYEPLFTAEAPGADGDFLNDINPASLAITTDARTGAAGRETRRADPVRTAGLFLRRPGFNAGQARLQPHRRPARQLREDRRVEIINQHRLFI